MAYHGIAPSFGEEGVAKDLDRVPRVDVTRVQRGEAESHHRADTAAGLALQATQLREGDLRVARVGG
jgi:hypothetical protein